VKPVTVNKVPAGVDASLEASIPLRCGDLVLTHGDYFFSKLIRFGQRLRYPKKYASWNHAALVLGESGNIAEALGHGVVQTHISKYKERDYTVVHRNISEHDQKQILQFAYSVLAAKNRYGWRTIVSLFFNLAFNLKYVTVKYGTNICSGFYADALTRAGDIWPDPPAAMKPAGLAQLFDAPDWNK
jgi:hypothetical protein